MPAKKTTKSKTIDKPDPSEFLKADIIDKCNDVLKGSGVCVFLGHTLEQNTNFLQGIVTANEKKFAELEKALPKQRKVLAHLRKIQEKRDGKSKKG